MTRKEFIKQLQERFVNKVLVIDDAAYVITWGATFCGECPATRRGELEAKAGCSDRLLKGLCGDPEDALVKEYDKCVVGDERGYICGLLCSILSVSTLS